MAETPVTDITLDPAVSKLIEYAKEKKTLSYDELSDFLPEHIANSDKIEQVLILLETNNVQLIEEEAGAEEEAESRKSAENEKSGWCITKKNPQWTIRSNCICGK
jgi:RNA polymerase primary sigma factor